MDDVILLNVLTDTQEGYNKIFKDRTKKLALDVLDLYRLHCTSDQLRIIGKQLLRSATSVAANYRAVVRARSNPRSMQNSALSSRKLMKLYSGLS